MRTWIVALGFGLATCLSYASVFGMSALVYDDAYVLSTALTHPWPVTMRDLLLSRLVSTESLRVQWELWPSVPWLHAGNLALHLVNGWLVYRLARVAAVQRIAAVLGAGVLLLHPIQVSAVVLIAGRVELLATMALLLACLVACRWGWTAALPAAGIAILSKPSAAIVAILVPLVAGRGRTRCAVDQWIWLGVSMAALVWVMVVAPEVGRGMSWEFMLRQAMAAHDLLIRIVVPVGLTIDHDYTSLPLWQGIIGLIFLGSVCWLAWLSRARAPLVAVGLAWVLIVVLPRLLIVTPTQFLAERHMYVVMVGVAISVAGCIDHQRAERM